MSGQQQRGPVSSKRARLGRLDSFEWIMLATMGLCAVVFIEPAPFDLLAVGLLPLALLLRRLAIPRGSAFALVCVALFIVANVLSLPAAKLLFVGARFFAITAYLILAWALVLGFVGKSGERALQVLFAGWAIGATVTSVLAIGSYFGVLPFAARMAPQGRVHALFKDANVYGAYLVAPAVWAVAQLVSLERGRRLPWTIVLVVCAMGVLLTYSRGAWISLALGLAVFFGLRMVAFGSPRSRAMLLLMVPVAAVLLALALDRLASVDVVQTMLDQRLGLQRYDTDRFATQREALEVATRTPLGIGPGQSESTFTRAAHNAYVRAFVENGYLGGLSLAALLFGSFFRSAWLAIDAEDVRVQTAMAVVAGSLAAICVESMVIDSVHWRHTWILAGMAWLPGLTRGGQRGQRARGPTAALAPR
ncbi:hypothetical protein PPSIR1_29790 [Plesiocystis pacifica SIR-1]|uniref:O-antigen ligase-related domain-containing protein n=1 Tax=Plesiocystis pacifica SIR-1 TaxID=391625 RepID=A6FYT7_9BACT|nr:O-antigen ligase family protein [Plesiocystis pacifica]EDM81092.1 hypothetical protein PPSIR1_29790 [Plesiocystis pacifica SIR-1]